MFRDEYFFECVRNLKANSLIFISKKYDQEVVIIRDRLRHLLSLEERESIFVKSKKRLFYNIIKNLDRLCPKIDKRKAGWKEQGKIMKEFYSKAIIQILDQKLPCPNKHVISLSEKMGVFYKLCEKDAVTSLKYYFRALSVKQTKYGSMYHESIASTLSCIGWIYYESIADINAAYRFTDLALKIQTKLFGGSPRAITVYANQVMGAYLHDTGFVNKAMDHLVSSLEMAKKLPRPNLCFVVASNNLGYVSAKNYDLSTALKYYNEALSEALLVSDDGSFYVSMLKLKLANLYCLQGNKQEVQKLLEVVSKDESYYRGDRWSALLSFVKGVFYFKFKKNYALAENFMSMALMICERLNKGRSGEYYVR